MARSVPEYCKPIASSCIIRHPRRPASDRRDFITRLQERTAATMGSAALSEAIKSIRDWSMNEGRASTSPAKAAEIFGSLVFNDKVQQERLPKPAYRALRATITRGEPLDVVDGRRRGDGAEGLGRRARRHALHALVPADDRHHRREARLVSRADRRRRGDRRVPRQGTDQGRARRVELPVRRHALHLRGARLHGVGSDQPALASS